MADHWFDALNKALVQEQPRRALLGAATALVANLGAPLSAMAKKGHGKGKGKGKGKNRDKHKNKNKNKGRGKDQPTLCGPDIHRACEAGYSGEASIQFCQDKCESCKAAGIEFCIFHEPDEEHGDVHATCCPGDEVCCNDTKCCAPDKCCEVNGVARCLGPGESCCPGDIRGFCPQGSTCCGGVVCRHCVDPSKVLDPLTCECKCAGGLAECDDICRDTQKDENFCGGCDAPPCTGAFERCCDGACVDIKFNNAHCGIACHPCPADKPQCCWGNCINPAVHSCCRDADSAPAAICGIPNAACCPIGIGPNPPIRCCDGTCCTRPDGAQVCCPR